MLLDIRVFSSLISLIKLSAVVYFLAPQQDVSGQGSSGGREGGMEGQNGGDGKRKPTNCHPLGQKSDRGRDGGEGQESQKS